MLIDPFYCAISPIHTMAIDALLLSDKEDKQSQPTHRHLVLQETIRNSSHKSHEVPIRESPKDSHPLEDGYNENIACMQLLHRLKRQ